jgi:hypothetical protein
MSCDESKMIRLVLGKSASEALEATGERSFAIVHRCMRGVEEPETAGRWCIHLAPVEWDKARDAAEVLMGTKRATKSRATTTRAREAGSLTKPHFPILNQQP